MFNRGDEVFSDTQLGRRGLWNKLKVEIAEGCIKVVDGYPMKNIRLDVYDSNIDMVNKYLQYGVIEKKEGVTS